MSSPLVEVVSLMARLGATSFGGPAAHVAIMRQACVVERGWLSDEEFLDAVALTALLPGPNSTELAMHLGRVRAGTPGLWLGGLAFLTPAVVLTGLLAWAYARWGQVPEARAVLWGLTPVMLAVIGQAMWGLAPRALASWPARAVAASAAAAVVLGAPEIAALLCAGVAMVILRCGGARSPGDPKCPQGPETRGARSPGDPQCPQGPETRGTRSPGDPQRPQWPETRGGSMVAAMGATSTLVGSRTADAASATTAVVAAASATTAAAITLPGLLFVFAKCGALLFGSGYVLVSYLRADLVEARGWLTEAQLLDAVAAGQLTPGPVFSTATFIGYQLAGVAGAAVATVGIFAPAFLLSWATGPLLPRLRANPRAAAFLAGVGAAALALLAVVTVELGRSALADVGAALIFAAALLALIAGKVNATWLLAAGALVGAARWAIG